MRKITTLFVRDENDRRHVTRDVTPGCEWVVAGEGVPTRKYDGTCVMYDGAAWWARREVKPGKTTPPGFVPVETDETTGKTVGWEPVEQSAFARWHEDALRQCADPLPGTYELCGPKINGDPEKYGVHRLIRHETAEHLDDAPRDFEGLAMWLSAQSYEGVVWHHPDGRMAKLKRRDFPVPS